jgi:hypothetical protein
MRPGGKRYFAIRDSLTHWWNREEGKQTEYWSMEDVNRTRTYFWRGPGEPVYRQIAPGTGVELEDAKACGTFTDAQNAVIRDILRRSPGQ